MLKSFSLRAASWLYELESFFKADLAGKFPNILSDGIVGEEASKLSRMQKIW